MSALVHIAVIDDDEAVLDSLRLYFARQGIETSCFASAKEFLAAIEGGPRFVASFQTSVCPECPASTWFTVSRAKV